MMWLAIFAGASLLAAAGLIYLSSKLYRLPVMNSFKSRHPRLAGICCLALCAAAAVLLFLLSGFANGIVIILHFFVILLIADFALWLAGRIARRHAPVWLSLAAAIIISAAYLGNAYHNNAAVRPVYYELSTEKSVGSFRLVQLSDSHIGTSFNAAGFEEYLRDINELSPDAVVITGDFVDDGTSRSDMLAASRALSILTPEYGVYFVYGNHDKGYSSAASRGWNAAELAVALEENGVIILEDESVCLDGRINIAGRRDYGDRADGSARLSPAELISAAEPGLYTVVLDHQPHEYALEAEAGADLVLSGHTHGGQLFPIGPVSEWLGINDRTYGLHRIGNTDFIISSGISDWALWFKSGCRSEYGVIDITTG